MSEYHISSVMNEDDYLIMKTKYNVTKVVRIPYIHATEVDRQIGVYSCNCVNFLPLFQTA